VTRGVVVAVLYPVLIGGLPLVALLNGRGLGEAAFGMAAGGAAAAVLLDDALVTVASLAIAIAVHRGLVAVGLGLLAAGAPAAERVRGEEPVDPRRATPLAAGIVLWIVAAVAPHTVL